MNAASTESQTTGSLQTLTLDDLPSLRNLTASDLLARFGQPDFTRHEAEAEIWQYRGNSCVLDLFLYPSGDDLKVADAVTRDRTRLDGAENSCTLMEGKPG